MMNIPNISATQFFILTFKMVLKMLEIVENFPNSSWKTKEICNIVSSSSKNLDAFI